MKLNFWQWLGVVLLILGVCYFYYGHFVRKSPDAIPITPATSPASPPTASAT